MDVINHIVAAVVAAAVEDPMSRASMTTVAAVMVFVLVLLSYIYSYNSSYSYNYKGKHVLITGGTLRTLHAILSLHHLNNNSKSIV
jgi:predicted Na+-dependent transporter